MSSIQAFRCGRPLRPLELRQVLSVPLPRRRLVRCPRCGYAVWVIVHPVGALVCAGCQAESVVAPPDTRATAMEGALLSGRVSQGAR